MGKRQGDGGRAKRARREKRQQKRQRAGDGVGLDLVMPDVELPTRAPLMPVDVYADLVASGRLSGTDPVLRRYAACDPVLSQLLSERERPWEMIDADGVWGLRGTGPEGFIPLTIYVNSLGVWPPSWVVVHPHPLNVEAERYGEGAVREVFDSREALLAELDRIEGMFPDLR